MKKLISLFLVLSSASAMANGQISWNSGKVPADVQNKVASFVSKNCAIFGQGLKEAQVVVRRDRIDQGIVDMYYTIDFTTSQRYEQNMFEDVHALRIEVAHYDVNISIDQTEVLSVKTNASAAQCK